MRLAISLLPLALIACQETLPTAEDVGAERGAALYEARCAECHGVDATGGVGPDLTGIAARNGGTFPQTRVMAQIDGMGRHGDPDAVMPEFGAVDMGDTVVAEVDGEAVPVPEELLALATYLESVQR